MFDWLKSFFGKGRIRVAFTTEDGKEGVARMPYIGEYNERDALREFKKTAWVDHGIRIKDARVIGRIVE